jgi:uncharacterized protein YcgL (UPF0745 family)
LLHPKHHSEFAQQWAVGSDPCHRSDSVRRNYPYLIRRIDKEQIPASLDMVSGVPNFFSGEIAWAAEHKLRPADRNEVLAILEKLAPLSEPA